MTTTETTAGLNFAEADSAATRLETAARVRRQNNGGFHTAESAALAEQAAELRRQSAAAFDAAASADVLNQPASGTLADSEAYWREQSEADAAAAPAQRANADRIAEQIFRDVKGGGDAEAAPAAASAPSTADVATAAAAGDFRASLELVSRAEQGDTAAYAAANLP